MTTGSGGAAERRHPPSQQVIPFLLCKSHLTPLLIRRAHERVMHGGSQVYPDGVEVSFLGGEGKECCQADLAPVCCVQAI